MIIFSPAVISDRLQALTRALDFSIAASGKLHIYGNLPPSTAGLSVNVSPLVTVIFERPSLHSLIDGVLTLSKPIPSMIFLSGVATWARFENGDGDWVADASVGLVGSGAAIQIDNLQLYAGALLDLNIASLIEV